MLERFKEHVYVRNLNFPWQTFVSETIIIDPDKNYSFELNELGTFIWHQMDGEKTMIEIIEAILIEYETSDKQVAEDLVELIESLEKADLIRKI